MTNAGWQLVGDHGLQGANVAVENGGDTKHLVFSSEQRFAGKNTHMRWLG